jgi:hypothetical protein
MIVLVPMRQGRWPDAGHTIPPQRSSPGGFYVVTRQKPLPKGSAQRVRLPQSPDSWPSTIRPSLVISDVDRPTSSTEKSR